MSTSTQQKYLIAIIVVLSLRTLLPSSKVLEEWNQQLSNSNVKHMSTTSQRFARDHYDVCIVGAGLSGSVIAEQHASQLGQTSLIVEKRNHIGGNCYDYVDPDTGILVNKYGAHLFHTKYPRVWHYLQQFSEWTPFEHRVLARIRDKHVPVPVNIDTVNKLFDLNISSSNEMDTWLAAEQTRYDHDPQNSEEMAMSRVGPRLFKLIFEPYTQKQWAKHPKDLGPEVTARIPVRNNRDDRYFDDVFQALPTHGYTAIFERMLDNPLIETHLNTDYFEVREELTCGKTYFTGPIDSYFASLGWEKLEYRSLDFERKVIWNTPSYHLPAPVVNYPSLEYDFTRIVEYKHFLKQASNHTVLFLERSKDGGEPYYPVPNEKNQNLFAQYKSMASKEPNVTFVGRLANYKYFNMDESVKNALEIFDEKAPRVVVQLVLSGITGGPEALVQLVAAFYSWMPSRTAFDPMGDRMQSFEHYSTLYPTLKGIPRVNTSFLRPGDVFIIPEMKDCPTDLVQAGVKVYIWMLGQLPDNEIKKRRDKGCQFVSHNFWLQEEFGLQRKHTFLPYVGSWAVTYGKVVNDKRENLIVVNSHDKGGTYGNVINAYCEKHQCSVVKPRGLNQMQLIDLYDRTKIIFASCMRGSERMVLEATLHGAVLVTDNCWTGSDTRDFPVPKRNVVTPNTLPEAFDRILKNFIAEQADYEGLRSIYQRLGPRSLEEDTKRFMREEIGRSNI